MLAAFDFTRIGLSAASSVVREVDALRRHRRALPPGSDPKVGMLRPLPRSAGPVEGVEVIETLNGGSRGTENDDAIALAEEYGYRADRVAVTRTS